MKFTIFQTKTTPYADFRNGHLLIKGKSVPFDYPKIYDTIRDRLKVYMQKPEKEMKIDFNFSAINAVSKRSIIHTFRLLEEMNSLGANIQVNWYYHPDDDNVYELGEICKSTFKIAIFIRMTT
jgi:hypothetical protein